jgi:type IV secretion system protein VirB9
MEESNMPIRKNIFSLFCAGSFALSLFVSGCKTTDMTPRADTERVNSLPPLPLAVEAPDLPEPQIISIEKPVYIPEHSSASPQVKAVSGVDAVNGSVAKGTIAPQSYSYAAHVYDYHTDQVFEVYTQILRTTDIYLEPGELVLEVPFISDSERWVLGAGLNRENGQVIQHIYVKPKEAGLEASMIINTDRRVYHVLLRSYQSVYMPMVRWNYKVPYVPLNFAQKDASHTENGTAADVSGKLEYVDPRFLSFDYTVKYKGLRKPSWMPRLVYDDGRKTYLVFNEQVLQRELPAVFENSGDIINYRVHGELTVIDKLIETVTVKYRNKIITVTKKRGK